MEKTLDEKILDLASLAKQIGSIALCASLADVEKRTVDNLMNGIILLSELINDKLETLSEELQGVSV